jgi:hypothetical protein
MPDIVVHETKELDVEVLDTLVLDSMEHDKEPNTIDSDVRSEV